MSQYRLSVHSETMIPLDGIDTLEKAETLCFLLESYDNESLLEFIKPYTPKVVSYNLEYDVNHDG